MEPIILFRKDINTEEEFDICKKYFVTKEFRSEIPTNSLVIGRFSILPFYNELEIDVHNLKSKLVNSYKEHCWIANFDWYNEVEEYTFKSWFSAHLLPENEAPFVVKGRTNSRKFDWENLMFAPTKHKAIEIGYELSKDSLIGNQGLVYRKYEPLVTFEIGLNGLRFTNEFRFFFYKKDIISHSYYWVISENIDKKISDAGYEFAKFIGSIVALHVNFFVIDIAEKENGDWVLVEINDGQMSGLSGINPEQFYSNLIKLI